MADANFIPWLDTEATTNQQEIYKDIVKVGFKPDTFVKAGDFNAALRMTTLVCAGIAKVFGFDSTYTIDASEDTIAKAIQNASITLGDVTLGDITSHSITSNTTIRAKGRITSDNSYNLGAYTVIDSGSNIMGASYKTLRGVSVIDSVGNITGTDITAAGTLKGKSLNINDAATITDEGIITGALVSVNKASMTYLGFTAGPLLVIDNDANISAERVISKTITGTNITASGVLKGNSLNINNTGRVDSSGNITGASYNVGSNAVIDSNRNITGTNITASGVLKGNSLNINNTGRVDSSGNITGASYNVGSNAVIDSNRNITGTNITGTNYIAAPYFDMNTCSIVYSGLFMADTLRNIISEPFEPYNAKAYQYLYYVVIGILYRGKTNYSTFSGWLPFQKLYFDKQFNGVLYLPVPNYLNTATKYISITVEATSIYGTNGTKHNMLIDFRDIKDDVTPDSSIIDYFHTGTRVVIYRVAKNMVNPTISN